MVGVWMLPVGAHVKITGFDITAGFLKRACMMARAQMHVAMVSLLFL